MSFYLLRITNTNFELKRDDVYIYNNMEKIGEKLIDYLTSNIGCFETIWLGTDIILYRYTNYKLVESVDIHKYILYQLDKYPVIYFDNNMPIVTRNDGTTITDKTDAEFDEYFCTNIFNGEETIRLQVSMPSIENLEGTLVDKFDIFILDNKRVHYGYNDYLYDDFFSDTDDSVYPDDSESDSDD